MKRKYSQGYSDRLDESLGERHRGPHKQSLKDRRDESKAMERRDTGHAYAGDRSMDKALHRKLRAAHHRVMADYYGSES